MKMQQTLFICLAFVAMAGIVRSENRSIDGSGNNLGHPDWGSAGIPLRRMAAAQYADGISSLAGADRLSPREISNRIVAATDPVINDRHLCGYVWQWGQFLDHDLDLTPGGAEAADIPVPAGDVYFDPLATGMATIPFMRSEFDPATGTSAANPLQQVNAITAYIDASNVYGSDSARAGALRTFSGGKLLTRADNLLPKNTFGLPNANGGPFADADLVLAGDVRANEQLGLTAMHTLFVREHNRLADELARANPDWSDEEIYQRARKVVGAQMQVITVMEFLPALLGPAAPSLTSTYDPSIDASIATEFSTALYRLGHSMLVPELPRMQNDGTVAPGGYLPLRDAFFNPTLLSSSLELDYIVKGLATQKMQEIDTKIVDDLRNFLFGPPGAGGLDLASLNIQRGRDHGLPDYNTVRIAYGLAPAASFADITSDVNLQNELAALYGDVEHMDLWIGALAEDHLPGASVGQLLAAGIAEQFTRLRDGDRFWYRHDPEFSQSDITQLEATRLSDIVMRNTGVTTMQSNVMFFIPEPGSFVLLVFGVVGLSFAGACRWRRQDLS
jgi:hypothetical protein